MPTTPYLNDDTRSWVETFRKDGKIKPNVIVRTASDTNYVMNLTGPNLMTTSSSFTSAYTGNVTTHSLMNLTLPGMRIPGLNNWQVTETLDQLVQSASFELINALYMSTLKGTLRSTLPARHHNPLIQYTYVKNGDFVLTRVKQADIGNKRINQVDDPKTGHPYVESNVKFRVFAPEVIAVDGSSTWPDPSVPNDDDGKDGQLTYAGIITDTGIGSYFILIDDEVIRVSGRNADGSFVILPGGRAQNGVLQTHYDGAQVTLLGLGPRAKGDVAGIGYLAIDDFKPYKHLLRAGTCLSVYEGYGTFPTLLSHDHQKTDNYIFTGFWFVKGLEASLGDDMVPKLRVDVASSANALDQQKITPDLVQRVKTSFGEWQKGEDQLAIWGDPVHSRAIPASWSDYHNWDPTIRDAYPLSIKTEVAQNKAFYDHMQETNFGLACDLCLAERAQFLKDHPINADTVRTQYNAMSAGPAKTALGQVLNNLEQAQNRAIGQHIFKESIRVHPAGPIYTYLRLMGVIAAASWDHPAEGSDVAQRLSKIPNELFDNISSMDTGLIFNGQVTFALQSNDKYFDFTQPGYDDHDINLGIMDITCPFDSSYDKAPFTQPMQDLADVNGNTLWINRKGQVCFMPRYFPMRPWGPSTWEQWEWRMSYGASVATYSHSLTVDSVTTQCWVTATTAFDSTFTVAAAGTGYDADGNVIFFSPEAGNKDGLSLTSGVQQIDTVSMDNLSLGLDWNVHPAGWGLKQDIEDSSGTFVINQKPQLNDGSPEVDSDYKGTFAKKYTEVIQKTINFFMNRLLLPPISYNNKHYYTIWEDGHFGGLTEAALGILQQFLLDNSTTPDAPGDTSTRAALTSEMNRKVYGRDTYKWIKYYLDNNKRELEVDIYWYVYTGRSWDEYVGAITGVPVPLKSSGVKKPTRTSKNSVDTPAYIIDDLGLQKNVTEWHKNFTKQAINVGNKVVDDSINKASIRSVTSNIADPRIQPGDVIWLEIPGHLSRVSTYGKDTPPYSNGMYISSVSRSYDLQNGSYTASYSGYRYKGNFKNNDPRLISGFLKG